MAKKEKVVKEKKQTSYFKEMKAELKKVVWPTPKELINNTLAVIIFVLIIAVVVFVLDVCFDNLNKYGITKLQEKVQSSFQATDNSDNSDEAEAEESENTSENEEGNEVEAVEENGTDNSSETNE